MNKKFSTLFAAAMLLSAGTVDAVKFDGGHIAIPTDGLAVSKMVEGQNSGLYQIAIKSESGNLDQVLSMDDNGFLTVVPNTFEANRDANALARTLWCVTISTEDQGQAPKFDFLNKGTGMYLDLTMSGELAGLAEGQPSKPFAVGGEIGGWAFSETYVESVQQDQPLFSYFKSDSVVGLALDAKKNVIAYKESAKDAKKNIHFQAFTLRTADEVVLTAEELNTIFGTQKADAGVKLKFTPDILGTTLTNPFNHEKFVTEAADEDYLYVSNLDKTSYLKVDTAYTNASGVKFLAYGWTEKGESGTALEAVKASAINKQHQFKFIYSPSFDKLYIYVKDVTKKADDKKYWAGVASEDNGDHRVSLQDLITGQVRILTVDYEKQNTTINLGFGDCTAVGNSRTSIADGVYFIKNNKGEYLASPIYDNGKNAKWVALNEDEQNPAHMPAYQWVVLKNNLNDVTNVSPVDITNREYANLNYNYAQLYKDNGAKYYSISAVLNSDSVDFVAVPAASVTDPNLGYKKFAKDELMINKYTFNYWHPYADDKFISQAEKDSTLSVLEGANRYFNIDTLVNTTALNTVNIPYGYEVTKAVQARIKGLAQLNRTVYEISLNGSDWKVNKDDKFNVGTADNNNKGDYYVFFKENNQFGDKCYHAIVKVKVSEDAYDAAYTTDYVIANFKAGVSDYDGAATLKNQVLAETRTSAFNIAPDETPLYRRFNSEKLEGHAGDGVDTLRFYEKYRNEFLMIENNSNFMVEGIDFLGIYTPDKANGGLAFQVDSAWVNRGYGHIKPQYLISIDRHDFAGVAGEPCTESGPHIDESGHITDDPYECVHAHKAVPGFKRGKFLINFHNYANASDKVNGDKYKWAGYDRAGFKEAIVYKDTLYVLRDEFKNLANEKIDFAAIKKADAEAVKAGEISYIYSLLGDNHKYVTWSMRFYDRTVSANEVEADRAFLFESMNKSENANVEQWIAPSNAAWLKMQNGCLVLSDYSSSFDEVVTGGDDALIFNVEYVPGDEVAVDNENIAVEGVSVVAGNGQVTIMGAAGKNVTITNILGKVIANQTIASDNATIAVPAGIVAVAVEGEAAVKAVVK